MNRFIVKPNKTVKQIIEGSKPLRCKVGLGDSEDLRAIKIEAGERYLLIANECIDLDDLIESDVVQSGYASIVRSASRMYLTS